jgi:hypothetical protein
MKHQYYKLGISLSLGLILSYGQTSIALPPAEDIPEEVLRTEIITEARSPIDGQPVTAAEYAQIQAQLKESAFAPELDPKVQELIFLLHIRKMLKTFFPF